MRRKKIRWAAGAYERAGLGISELQGRSERILREALEDNTILRYPKAGEEEGPRRVTNVEIVDSVPDNCAYSDGSRMNGVTAAAMITEYQYLGRYAMMGIARNSYGVPICGRGDIG